MTVRSKITLFNAALLRTGNDTVVEGDGSFVWRALEANYDELVRDAFEGTEYTFGKVRSTLTGRSAGRFGYDDAYSFPSEVIHIVEVYLEDISAASLGESWEVDASTSEVMVNAQGRTVEIKYLKTGTEHTWSGRFARGVQRRLEAVIKDVLEEVEEAAALDTEADYQFLKAGVKSSKNRSKVKAKRGGRLIRAHRR